MSAADPGTPAATPRAATPADRIRARYRIRAAASEVDAIARAVAIEQSVEVPLAAVRDPWVREHIVGRVDSIEPDSTRPPGTYLADISLAADTMAGRDGQVPDVAQTFNMLFGNSSMHDMVELVDVEFPGDFARRFGGPRFGLDGLRALLGPDAAQRPLTCAALKPQGLPPAELAQICGVFARSGIDIIKDDHGLADQAYAPFPERVSACQRAIAEAQRDTGRKVLYAPSLVGAPRTLAANARLLREEGIGAALLAPMLVGLPAFHELVAEHVQVPVLAHPAFCGTLRIDRALLLGKLFRMLGADAVIYPHYMGRFAWPREQCGAIARAALAPWPGIRAAVPVPAGGMTVERVPELVGFYGADVMLLIGGSLLIAGDALAERTRHFVTSTARCAIAAAIGRPS